MSELLGPPVTTEADALAWLKLHGGRVTRPWGPAPNPQGVTPAPGGFELVVAVGLAERVGGAPNGSEASRVLALVTATNDLRTALNFAAQPHRGVLG